MEMGLFYLHPKVVYIYLILRSFVILLYADIYDKATDGNESTCMLIIVTLFTSMFSSIYIYMFSSMFIY